MKQRIKIIPLYRLLIAGWLMSSSLFAQHTLDAYLMQAAEQNPGLKAQFLHYQAALEKVPQVGALPDPMVSFGLFVSPVETRLGAQRGNLSVSQYFPWFGTPGAKQAVATAAAKAKFEAFQSARSKLFYDLRQVYFQLYALRSAVRSTRDNLVLLNSMETLAQGRFEAGKSSFAHLLRIQLERNELDNDLQELEASKLPLEARFHALLNGPMIDSLVIPDTLTDAVLLENEEEIRERIRSQNPKLLQLDHEADRWAKQVRVADKHGKPSFSIGVDYTPIAARTDMELPQNGRDAFLLPRVGFNIPIHRKQHHAMVHEAKFQQQAVKHQREDRNHQLETEMAQALYAFQDANRRINLYRTQNKLARQALDILLATYRVSGTEFEEFIGLHRDLLRYAMELEAARADQHIAKAYLTFLTGE